MKRITAGTIDYGICCILACICRIGFTVLCGWALQGTGAQVPYFTLPLYKMGESAGIGTLILNYGVFSQHKFQLFLYFSLFLFLLAFERGRGGHTPGKRLCGLEVCRGEIRCGEESGGWAWMAGRIGLKMLCLRFWYIGVIFYMQTGKMPYDNYLGLTVKTKELEKEEQRWKQEQ